MQFQKNLITIAAALAFGAASTTLFAAPITTEGVGVGKHGDIRVAVTFDNGKIQKIDILKNAENPVLSKKVFTDLKDQVAAASSVQVDIVSGATFTSKGMLDAIEDAAKKAGVTLGKADKNTLNVIVKDLPKNASYDVVVIGAGGAGFSAAIEAKNAGANVVLLEKMPQVGGNSLISGAEMNVARNWVQPKLGITDDSPELHAKDTYLGGDKKGDMNVINVMTRNALAGAEWCRDYLGIRFEPDNLFFFGGHSRKRALIPVGHTGTEFITKFLAKADELGIPVITNMKAEELLKDKAGRVVGVKATMNGTEYTFNAKGGVVLATGGFGANPAMVKKYNPKIDERFKTTDAPGTTGEVLYMAQRAGAELVNMQYIQTYPICDPISGVIELIADARFDGAIMLNQEGKRFVEELGRRDVLAIEVFDPEMVGEPGYDYNVLASFAKNKISYIAKNTNANTITHFVSEKSKNLDKCLKELKEHFHGAQISTREVAIVSVIGTNMKLPGFLHRAAKALAESKINVLALDQCIRQVNMQFIIDREDFETAQKALHRELVEHEQI